MNSLHAVSCTGRESLGIYIHVPFCASKCAYCDFYSQCAPPEAMASYIDAVKRCLSDWAPRLRGYCADTIYFGGGTPSILGVQGLSGLLDAVSQSVLLSANVEITLEANPGALCGAPGQPEDALAVLTSLRGAGFNRISYGVQSAHGEELRMLGRRHSFADAEHAFHSARTAGFDNITLDLMYALPNQGMEQWQESVRRIVALGPEHLSCYGLRLSEDAPLYRLVDAQPDEDVQLAMYLWLVDYAEAMGYAQYEISNFARPGYRSRHNMKYWDLSAYIGFGPSAHSYFEGRRFSWPEDLAALRSGGAPDYEPPLSQTDMLQEYIMLRIRTTDGLSLSSLAARWPVAQKPFISVLSRLSDEGLCKYGDGAWHLTPRGFFVSNAVILSLWEAAEDACKIGGK